MIDKNLNYSFGENCHISPDAYIGFKEHRGSLTLRNNVTINHGCVIRTCTGTIYIGNNSSIGYYSIIHALGGVRIGDNVMISPNVQIYAQCHGMQLGKIMRNQPQTCEGIEIEDDVWIGAGSIILDGVKIRKGSVIGAGSLVNKNIPEYEIWAGNPCRKIGERK